MTHEEFKIIEDTAVAELFKVWENKQILTEFNGPDFVPNKEKEILQKYDINNLYKTVLGKDVDFIEQSKFLYEMAHGVQPE